MRKKIAVEKNLASVRAYFEKNGYEVDSFDDSQLFNVPKVSEYDALVISGGNKNFLGIEDTELSVPVIEARGMSPEEVYNRLNR